MSLIFIEGFDNVTAITLGAKGWATGPGSDPVVMSSTARTGAQSLYSRAASGNSHDVQRVLPAAAEHATLIAGFALRRSMTDTGATVVIDFRSDSGSTDHIRAVWNASGTFSITRGDGTVLGTSSATLALNTWGYLEFSATLADSGGAGTIRLNGVSILTLTGIDTKNGGTKTVFDSIRLGTATGDSRYDAFYDDLYLLNGAGSINNAFLGDCKVQTLLPDGNGNASQMVGSDADSTNNYALINAALPQTATYVGTPTTDNEDTYSHGDLPSVSAIKGVQINAYATKTDVGSRSLSLVARRSGADYAGPDVALPFGSQTFVQRVLETDPSTSAAWTAAAVNAAEFGARARP